MATFAAGFPLTGDDDSPSVEAVGFSSSLPVAVTGSLSGVLGIWDLPTQRLRQQLQHEVGTCAIAAVFPSRVVWWGLAHDYHMTIT